MKTKTGALSKSAGFPGAEHTKWNPSQEDLQEFLFLKAVNDMNVNIVYLGMAGKPYRPTETARKLRKLQKQLGIK
jgi:hypothetical protein